MSVQVVRSGSLKTTYIVEELFERQTPTVLKDLTGVVTAGGCIIVGTVGSGVGCDWTILSLRSPTLLCSLFSRLEDAKALPEMSSPRAIWNRIAEICRKLTMRTLVPGR
jgi:hypothetical protein